MDVLGLSKTGFTLIRNLLQGRAPGGAEAAEKLSEALHNLPEPGNDFLQKMTTEKLEKFMVEYPDLAAGIRQHIL